MVGVIFQNPQMRVLIHGPTRILIASKEDFDTIKQGFKRHVKGWRKKTNL
jgi:hypothetical protein